MSRITEELVRKRAEHNNCEISTLEEISLHQQDIERIEHLDKWCKDLKILYLQSNLIPKIENVSRLKKLEYLNLALNNVTTIENLQGCERLQKLDLTVNFVGDLLSIESLQSNLHLQEMFLTGNPCTDYDGYREFVIATLPQLQWLDGKEISKSERIIAIQKLPHLREKILEQQTAYEVKRALEREMEEEKARRRAEKQPGFDGRWYTDVNAHTSIDDDEVTGYTPESRISTHRHIAEKRSETGQKRTEPQQKKKERLLVTEDGRILNINEGKYDFSLKDSNDDNQFELDLECPRFMDTSLIDCVVEPTHVRVKLKGKIFQLVLPEEVSPDSSSVKRSQTTGHLLITMPKVREVLKPAKVVNKRLPMQETRDVDEVKMNYLEVDPSLAAKKPDIYNVVNSNSSSNKTHNGSTSQSSEQCSTNSSNDTFVDNPEVPPLI
ncbi:dynein axonemal assembly factor 11-like isoform X2 [Dysidea avara]|uniref:dynein axonemal assembly factor 11-like isoform X2 n=1 Tax=Dysidea avara TaxID=196820 RepID=UPI00332260C6